MPCMDVPSAYTLHLSTNQTRGGPHQLAPAMDSLHPLLQVLLQILLITRTLTTSTPAAVAANSTAPVW